MSLLDDIKRDLEAGTPGPWRLHMGDVCADDTDGEGLVLAGMNKSCGGRSSVYGTLKQKNPAAQSNARRIARVPDMEAALLAAEDDRDALLDMLEDALRLWLEADPSAAETIEALAIALSLASYRAATGDA